jgi:uncharacterized protein
MRIGFDLRGVDTYYTRPMSEASSKTLNVESLADEQADLRLSVPLAEFPRVQPRLGGTAGTIDGRVRFGREAGFVVASIEVSGAVPLVCQRCLELMSWPIEGSARVALIALESQADGVPQHLEPLWAPGSRVSLRDLLEEEVLLCLPIVPLHAPGSACKPAGLGGEAPGGDSGGVQRPFERLGELLKRDT